MAITAVQNYKARDALSDWYKWNKGDYASLFNRPPSMVNGLSLLNPSTELGAQFNYFAASSRFFADAMLGDTPSELSPYLDLLESIVREWSITGEYCLVLDGGLLRSIPPKNVYPIHSERVPELRIGYRFIYPASDGGAAFVIEFNEITGAALEGKRVYSSGELGDWLSVSESPIALVIYQDTTDGYYRDIAGIVAELQIRFAMMQWSLNSTSIPILEAEIERITPFAQGSIAPAEVRDLGKSGMGLVLPPPFEAGTGARWIERTGTGLSENLEYTRLLLGVLSVLSGVPDYVYGVSLNQSPTEVERIMFAGQSRITRFRRSIERVFGRLGLDVSYGTEPFTTRRTKIDNVRGLHTDGIITLLEARGMLGI